MTKSITIRHFVVFVFLGLLSLVYQKSNAQCAGITIKADTNRACTPGIFEFVVRGAPSGSNFIWDFGKGPNPGKDTFRLIEPVARAIPLTLYTTLPKGGQCTTTVKKIAEVYARPMPKMSIGQKVFCSTSEPYQVTDLTSNSAYRIWTIEGVNYGDTAKARTANFSSDGKKSISLMVEDQHGCRGVKTFTDIAEVISDNKIEIRGIKHIGCVNTDFSFSIVSGFSPNEIKAVDWTFNGATTNKSTDIKPTHIKYPKGGNYDVSVKLTTKNGCDYFTTYKGLAQPKDSTVLDVVISDSSVCTAKDVKVVVRNKDIRGSIVFDVPNYSKGLIDSTAPTVRTISFVNPGIYDLNITHTDSFCTSHYTKKAFVSAKQVFARISSNQHYDCEIPFLAKFKDNSEVSESGKLTYRWLVFDSLGNLLSSSTNKDFDYLVKDSGYYDVELTVRHENGCADSTFQTELIRADSIRIEYEPISQLVCLNQEVEVQNSSFKSSYKVSDFYVWKLYRHGDTSNPIDSSYIFQPTFKAKYKGSYDLKVFAYNSLGCTQTDFREHVFEVGEPKAGFRVERPNQCPSDTFSLISSSTPDNGEYINKWMIYNAQDTILSYGEKPIIKMETPGIYHVSFNISVFGECRDTLVKNDLISINGIQSRIVLPTNRACENIPFRPKAVVENHIYNATDTSVHYEWGVLPNRNFTIDNDTAEDPSIQFLGNGNFVVRLVCINSFGCRDTSYSDTIYAGLRAKHKFLDTAVCSNTEIRFVNETDSLSNKWFYNLTPNTIANVQNMDRDTGSITIDKEGTYRLDLIASRDSICFDTTSTNIYIVSPKADFVTLDSNLYCAPAYQRFESKSLFADTLFWDFGDGKNLKSTQSKVTTLYERNTGSINPYTVRLIAKNRSGCADTLTKTNLVKVEGPAAHLTLSQNRGCEPLQVVFHGTVENVHKMYIDYGDGSEFGFEPSVPHAYFNKWRIIENTYHPVILVVDKNGCQTAFKTDSTIRVKPSPTAFIRVNDSIACSNLSTRYYYLGNEASSWFWDFNGDGTPDGNNASGIHSYTVPGRYNMTLVNINKFGCGDTAIVPIHVVKSPKVSILTDTVNCITKPFNVTDVSVLDTTIKSRIWTVQNDAGVSTKTDSSFVYQAQKPGWVKLKLSITDSIQCIGSDSVLVRIRDSMNNIKGEIQVVSVTQEGYIKTTILTPDSRYVSTVLDKELSGNFIKIKDSGTANLDFTDSLAATSDAPQCYQIRHYDSCAFVSQPSEKHCTIHLSTSSSVVGQNDLFWTPYVGWSTIETYEIWRTTDGNTELLKALSGQALKYTDSFLCDQEYCYTIVATTNSAALKSVSNAVCARPIYLGNNATSDIKLVTVVDDQFIQVQMASDSGPFVLSKRVGGNNLIEIETDLPVYQDYNVEVHSNSYAYGVKETDYCGTASQEGHLGKSIFVEISEDDLDVNLTWTAYQDWERGVHHYSILRNVKNGFVEYQRVLGSDTSLSFEVDGLMGASNCFKIAAVSHDSLISESNKVCIIGETLIFIPSAFSPNNNPPNDLFKPIMVFVKSPTTYTDGLYDFKIYDKWGGLLFETNDPEVGWDGMYNEKVLPEGVYVYTIRLKGLDNVIRSYPGSVTLLR
ncbi:MAG: gliding motility-associated-like protein [Bacteroidia bacterium]